jgi:outer membrane protein assembly factor BamD (BamD/ComL family)
VKESSISSSENQFNYADSLFGIGNYDIAKREYKKIRDNERDKKTIAYAQFNLAFIDVYFDNPFADYDIALEEFKRFISEFPNHPKASTAKNWIKILTVLRGFSREYKGSTETLTTIKEECDRYIKQFPILRNSYQRCEASKDSLINQVQVLERVIEEITKSQE